MSRMVAGSRWIALGLALSGCSVAGSSGDARTGVDLQGIDIQYGYEVPQPGTDSWSPDAAGPGPDNGPVVPTAHEYPSAELLVRITGPTARGSATTAGSLLSLTGIVFSRPGTPVTISWVSQSVDQGVLTDQGTADGFPFWMTGGITVMPGDNLVTVTAQAGGETATDTILITHNPSFPFDNPIEVRPPAGFVGEVTKVFATAALGPIGDLVDSALTLQQVDAQGHVVKELGKMKDDGNVSVSGDEIQKDGVYTVQFNFSCAGADPVYLRATALVRGAYGQQYTARSALTRFDCVDRLSVSACAAHQKTLAQAREAYLQAVNGGEGTAAARAAAIQVLSADPDVGEVASDAEDGGLWVQWKDQVLGALNTARGDTRGGDGAGDDPGAFASLESALAGDLAILSKSTLLLAPFASEFGQEEAAFTAGIVSHIQCPAYRVRGPQQNPKGPHNDAAASLKVFRQMTGNGIVVLTTHGETYFRGLSGPAKERLGWSHRGAQEVLWTGEAVDCARLTTTTKTCKTTAECPAGTECLITQAVLSVQGTTQTIQASGVCYDATQVDLMRGRVVLGDRTYGVTPALVRWTGERQKFPNSLVYLGACRTLYNGTLAAELFGAGARTVAGYTGTVTNAFARQAGSSFLAQMFEEKKTAGEAYGVGVQDPENPGSYFRLFGARNLTISQSDILNASFETSDLTAWEQDGDGRVLAKLGKTGPVSGKFVGIISTGLGFTDLTGSVQQTFCIPEGVQTLSFWWKYYSEEFHEWCGSEYQDTFQADLTGPTGQKYKVVDLAVDDLCKSDCNQACECYSGFFASCPPGMGSHYVGLTFSDVQFDQGDNWVTPWQKATYDVSALAGKGPVTLRFYCTDQGDSIYDTAVLVDGIKFE